MTTSVSNRSHPYYGQISELRGSSEVIKFFTEDIKRMASVSLGEALDFTSFGGMNYVVWEMSKRNMISFISTWMKNQNDKKYLWNREGAFGRDSSDLKFELPFINHSGCPIHKDSSRKIVDLQGRTRCAHVEKEYFRPSFIRTQVLDNGRVEYYEQIPAEPIEYLEDEPLKLNRVSSTTISFPSEDTSVEVLDPCYKILKENGINLSLESVLRRLDVSHSFISSKNISIYPFSGFELAEYVKSWHNQPGKKKLFSKDREKYNVFSNFVPISSED